MLYRASNGLKTLTPKTYKRRKLTMKSLTKLAALASLLSVVPAFAQVKINDTLSVTGWSVGSYQYTKPNTGSYTDSFNVDAALLQANITPTKNLTGVFSTYYRPSSEGGASPSSDVTLLDAYFSYDTGTGAVISAGKFVSYLGYESFYLGLDNMITLANQQFLAPIPGYHEGVKLDYTVDKTTTVGVAVVDSLYQKPGYNYTEGAGSLKHQAGFEGYYQYTGITNLTLWAGVGYETLTKPGFDTGGVVAPHGAAVTVYDLWGTYQINKASALSAEEIYKEGGKGNTGSNWLLYYSYASSDKTTTYYGLSGEKVQDGPSYVKYSISPTYALTANLSLRAQASYTTYSSFKPITDVTFLGAEFLFKF